MQWQEENGGLSYLAFNNIQVQSGVNRKKNLAEFYKFGHIDIDSQCKLPLGLDVSIIVGAALGGLLVVGVVSMLVHMRIIAKRKRAAISTIYE